jgi:hypothetical protein
MLHCILSMTFFLSLLVNVVGYILFCRLLLYARPHILVRGRRRRFPSTDGMCNKDESFENVVAVVLLHARLIGTNVA